MCAKGAISMLGGQVIASKLEAGRGPDMLRIRYIPTFFVFAYKNLFNAHKSRRSY